MISKMLDYEYAYLVRQIKYLEAENERLLKENMELVSARVQDSFDRERIMLQLLGVLK